MTMAGTCANTQCTRGSSYLVSHSSPYSGTASSGITMSSPSVFSMATKTSRSLLGRAASFFYTATISCCISVYAPGRACCTAACNSGCPPWLGSSTYQSQQCLKKLMGVGTGAAPGRPGRVHIATWSAYSTALLMIVCKSCSQSMSHN